MATPSGLSEEEQRAHHLIVTEEGLYQSELWKRLGVSSRKGSRIATSLEDAGMIEREEAVHNGQRTYLLRPAETSAEPPAQPDEPTAEQISTDAGDARDGLSAREQRALELITDTGGIYQSAMWKELDLTSREGSRVATSLEEKDEIEREEAVHKGTVTYFLKPPKRELDFSLLMAGDELSPFVESADLDPQDSAFSHWLLRLEENYVPQRR